MPGDLVLLTGATGYLGYLTLIALLKEGYQVRAAIRSRSKAAKVEAAPSFKALSPTVEWVVVPDMTASGAYDEAVKGVKYIVHVASPIPTFGEEPIPNDKLEEYFVATAPKGEIGILESARKADTVERIVVTSSVVAIVPFEYYLGQGDYSVEFGAEHRIPHAEGPYAFEFQAYSAGKAAALNAAEAWMKQHKPSFDMVSVIPGWIFGRDELTTDAESFKKGSTNSVLLNLLLGLKNEVPYNGNIVQGEDVAKIQALALNPKIKGNQSYLAAVDFEWEDAIEMLKSGFSEQVKSGVFSTEGKQPTLAIKHPIKQTEEAFGFELASPVKIVSAVAKQYAELVEKA